MNKLLSVLLLGALAVLVVTIKIAFKPSADVAVHAQGDLAVPGDLAKRATGVSGDYDDASETLRTMSELQKGRMMRARKIELPIKHFAIVWMNALRRGCRNAIR